jgi:glutathione S-transferase
MCPDTWTSLLFKPSHPMPAKLTSSSLLHSRRMTSLDLYSTPLCPYAHRVRIVIAEKHLPVRIVTIDPAAKPAEFLRRSPDGKVPLLAHGERGLSDSAVINEYLDNAFPAVPMLPKEPLARAQARWWIRWADAHLYEHTSQLLHSRDPAAHARWLAAIEQDLQYLEDHAFATPGAGPYWMGTPFTMVDATFHPWFEQFGVLQAFFGMTWPERCRRLAHWRDAVAVRPSVVAAARPDSFYLERYGALRDARDAQPA